MRRASVLTISSVAMSVALTVLGVTTTASASAAPELSAEQKAVIAQLNTPYTVAKAASKVVTPAATSSAASVYSARLQLYRGSVLMWARDTMNWYYTGSSLTSSSLQQEAGFVFPNTSQAKGVNRYYASSTQHSWRGNYTIGAGVVTPWGAVTVYSQDYSTNWNVYGNGAGNGSWNN